MNSSSSNNLDSAGPLTESHFADIEQRIRLRIEVELDEPGDAKNLRAALDRRERRASNVESDADKRAYGEEP